MINRAPVVLKKPVAIVQILQAASFVSRIFNSVISLPFCSCIFSTIILCLVTLANLCLYYLIILSKVCVFMICFFFLQNLCVYHLINIPKFVCLSSYKFLQVCVLNIWQWFTKFLCFLYDIWECFTKFVCSLSDLRPTGWEVARRGAPATSSQNLKETQSLRKLSGNYGFDQNFAQPWLSWCLGRAKAIHKRFPESMKRALFAILATTLQ